MKIKEQIFIVLVVMIFGIILLEYSYQNCNDQDNDQYKDKLEGFEDNSLNSEAIQNISSIYNKDDLSVTNFTATSSAKTNKLEASEITADSINVTKLNIIPRGVIVAWSGQINSIPAGWLLCNGQNETPDLRGRFILGFGLGRGNKIGNRGGLEKVTLTKSEMPIHSHRIQPEGNDGGWCKKGCKVRGTDQLINDNKSSGNQRTDQEGGGMPHENMPPYHTLAYIMKS